MSIDQDAAFEPDNEQAASLSLIFREQLIAYLEECAAGRLGLFSDQEHLAELNVTSTSTKLRSWPEAARLRELAFALQAILAQEEEGDELCEQFLDLCSIHGESDPGEPRLARAFLSAIGKKPTNTPTKMPTPANFRRDGRILK